MVQLNQRRLQALFAFLDTVDPFAEVGDATLVQEPFEQDAGHLDHLEYLVAPLPLFDKPDDTLALVLQLCQVVLQREVVFFTNPVHNTQFLQLVQHFLLLLIKALRSGLGLINLGAVVARMPLTSFAFLVP